MHMTNILEKVGNTPVVTIKIEEFSNLNLTLKLEAYNPTGSVKDRAAYYILKKLLDRSIITSNTVIIESTSGNFGVALSAYCKYYGLKFIAVVDPNITSMNEMLIAANGAEIIKVTKQDKYGGYLLTRIEKIKELTESLEDSYWINQYENPLNAAAYYHTLGKEMCFHMENIDYVFMGVSSGGTITGVSQKIKENYPDAKIIAVDVEGSVIFNNAARKRYIPGIGSSMVPKILSHARIDEVVLVNEVDTIDACYELLKKYNLFAGGSSGSVLAGIKKYFSERDMFQTVNAIAVFPDRGERYYDTIFNPAWCKMVTEAQSKVSTIPQVI
jgi:2,3-diaminopropionate biosynthesis protein SbnA